MIAAWIVFTVIVGLLLTALFAQIWEESAEIAKEEQRKKDFRELNRWKQRANHPMVFIKELDGEEFVLRRR